MRLLEGDGQLIKVLDTNEVLRLEPSLSEAKGKITGAIYCPTDETGDPGKFTNSLAEKVIARGGEIMTSTTVLAIDQDGHRYAVLFTVAGSVCVQGIQPASSLRISEPTPFGHFFRNV